MRPFSNLPHLLLMAVIGLAPAASGQDAGTLEEPQGNSPPLTTQGNAPLVTPRLNNALPAEQAFPLNVIVELPDHIVAIWEIRDGYYLYRDSLTVEEAGGGNLLGEPEFPPGEMTSDEFFGDVEVYYDRLLLRIPLDRTPEDNLELMVHFQGCAEIGYCYPMQFRQIELDFSRLKL